MNENWTPKNPPPELSDSDAELLSAYIDNMLDPQEKAALEARLQTDAFLRSELAAMRQMLGWLNTMPTLKAPRNFTLSEADVKPVAPKLKVLPRRNTWQVASAAAVFLVLLGAVTFLTQVNKAPASQVQDIAAMSTQQERLQETTALFAVTTTPMPVIMATAGAPQSAIAGGSPQDAQEEAVSEVSRSAGGSMGADGEMDPPPDDSMESQPMEPMESMGSGGSADTANSPDGTIAGEFGGNETSTGLADTQFVPTMTSNANMIAMPTFTLPPHQTAVPTMEALVAQPTEEAVVEEAESMAMSVMVESTEEAAVMSAPASEDTDAYDYNYETDGMTGTTMELAMVPLSLTERLQGFAYTVYFRILDSSQR